MQQHLQYYNVHKYTEPTNITTTRGALRITAWWFSSLVPLHPMLLLFLLTLYICIVTVLLIAVAFLLVILLTDSFPHIKLAYLALFSLYPFTKGTMQLRYEAHWMFRGILTTAKYRCSSSAINPRERVYISKWVISISEHPLLSFCSCLNSKRLPSGNSTSKALKNFGIDLYVESMSKCQRLLLDVEKTSKKRRQIDVESRSKDDCTDCLFVNDWSLIGQFMCSYSLDVHLNRFRITSLMVKVKAYNLRRFWTGWPLIMLHMSGNQTW